MVFGMAQIRLWKNCPQSTELKMLGLLEKPIIAGAFARSSIIHTRFHSFEIYFWITIFVPKKKEKSRMNSVKAAYMIGTPNSTALHFRVSWRFVAYIINQYLMFDPLKKKMQHFQIGTVKLNTKSASGGDNMLQFIHTY